MQTTAFWISLHPAATEPKLQVQEAAPEIQEAEALLSPEETMLPREGIQREAGSRREAQAAVQKADTATEAAPEEVPAEGDDWNWFTAEL